MTPYWWAHLPEERYWVEVRKAPGIGLEVFIPTRNVLGRRDSRWELVNSLRENDIVLHYDARESRFVGQSVVSSDAKTVDGYYRAPLRSFRTMNQDIGLERMREIADDLYRERDRLRAAVGDPLHLPFSFTQDRSQFRMLSNYFGKLPVSMVRTIFGAAVVLNDVLASSEEGSAPTRDSHGGFLQPFKPKADTNYIAAVGQGPKVRTRDHETLVNSFAEWLHVRGVDAGRNAAIDLGISSPAVVVEAKILGRNWAETIRAAVGQLYEYRYFHVSRADADLILLVNAPIPSSWIRYLEDDRNIGAVWPAAESFTFSRTAQDVLEKVLAQRQRN